MTQVLSRRLEFGGKHNAVIARHVLEHVNDPSSVLEKIFQTGLQKGGFLFLKLPRFDTWGTRFFKRFWFPLDVPRHRVHFTAEGLRRLLESLGYTDVDIVDEPVYLDLLRSLTFTREFDREHNHPWIGLFLRLPKVAQAVLAQMAAMILSPLGSGRMIAIAKRP